MSWLDIVLIMILAILAFDGWRHGFLHFVSEFIGLCLGIFVARLLYESLADKLGFISANGAAEIVAFIIICAIVAIVVAVLCHRILEPRIKRVISDRVNRLGGVVLGLIIGVALCIFIVLLLDKFVALPPGTPLEEASGIRQGVTTALNDSFFAGPILEHFGSLL
jgi:uncharacterized membrane protein required for colicin V production